MRREGLLPIILEEMFDGKKSTEEDKIIIENRECSSYQEFL